jgi:(4S)-4-hydroxy-5-phosphonooxypentane-2,3-dione isomerase
VLQLRFAKITDVYNAPWSDNHLSSGAKMQIVHVHVNVKPESIEAFKQATVENASQSIKEEGIARFDVIQQLDEPTKFILIEVYRTAEAPAAHKGTAHYVRWRDAVAGMMVEPRRGIQYANIFPDDENW